MTPTQSCIAELIEETRESLETARCLVSRHEASVERLEEHLQDLEELQRIAAADPEPKAKTKN